MSVWNDEFNRLCKAGAVSGPVSDLAIGQAENELGVQFPSEYHEFLRKYGAVFTRGVEVYGLIQVEEDGNPPLWQDVVTVTKQLRAMGQAGTDKNSFIPICDDGMDAISISIHQ
ncbi:MULTISPECIES: SMI1/KNR4 family protein [unclassified Halomonas]|uniref:SMI1/KNR4 family protein n=1 Tax=unclassified Halomonas TaxID=2609666 RepID=UPI001C95C5B0|nr:MULTISPECIES: SMI1/KNR4 family protein [unclassified Halomonas]MBY5925761.1 SMI1/KNR4 family protein [Halomonas sp. DP4Y7-2]MBY6232803.1 SMI1/KNR4 family protein [Halomonas sp. DP4Y7-1]